MASESNEPQLDAQQQAAKRAWSTPRVIESDVSYTNVVNPTRITPTDSFTLGIRLGPS